jgi:hypothetical protein
MNSSPLYRSKIVAVQQGAKMLEGLRLSAMRR